MRRFPAWVVAKLQPRLVLLFLLVLAVVSWNQIDLRNQRGQQIRQTCQAVNEAKDATADVFRILETAAREQSPGEEPQTAEERERADRFFRSVYARLEPVDC